MKKFTKVPARKAVIAMCAALSVGIFAPLPWCEAAPASSYTAAANQKVYSQLDFSDEQERKFAERGLIEAPQALEIRDAKGNLVWSQAAYSFLQILPIPACGATPRTIMSAACSRSWMASTR